MGLVAVLATVGALLNTSSNSSDFETFKAKFGKSYATAEEEAYRQGLCHKHGKLQKT